MEHAELCELSVQKTRCINRADRIYQIVTEHNMDANKKVRFFKFT